MTFIYNQSADKRWTAGEPAQTVNTVADAMRLEAGQMGYMPTQTSGGACQAISLWWLIKNALGDDFWTWFGPPRAAAPASAQVDGLAGEPVKLIKEVMNAQAALCRMPNITRSVNHMSAINYLLAHTKGHLTTKRGLVLRDNAAWKTLAYEITTAKGYCFIGFSRTGWGGHAVAAHIASDGSMRFMDPNVGELDFADYTSFYTWMDQQLGPYYGFDRLTTVELQTLSRPGQ